MNEAEARAAVAALQRDNPDITLYEWQRTLLVRVLVEAKPEDVRLRTSGRMMRRAAYSLGLIADTLPRT